MLGIVKGLVKLVLWVGVPLLAVAGLLQYFFVDRMAISHDGMAPTIFAGETLFVWRDVEPTLGKVMVCAHPRRPDLLVIGRVVAIPGMTVDAARGDLLVSGRPPSRDVAGTLRWTDPTTGRAEEVTHGTLQLGNFEHGFFEPQGGVRLRPTEVRSGTIYLLGDNRAAEEQDSRFFGPIDPHTCRGRVFLRAGRAAEAPPEISRPLLELL